MSEEIIAGIRNAMERGASLQQAVQSFLNAGYNAYDVREAERAISGGVSGIIYPEATVLGKHEENSLPEVPTSPTNNEQVDESPKEKKKTGKVVLILVIILSILVFLGAISYLVYTLLT
jgi:hypothetical protein